MTTGERLRGADELASALSAVARSWQEASDVTATVEAVVWAAVDHLEGAEHAGVCLVERGKIETVAASDDTVVDIDKVQFEVREGPCVDAIAHQQTYRTGDLDTERRWPHFTVAASATGIRSMLSYRLFTSQATMGALNLYSSQRDAFTEETEHEGLLFADHAAIALSAAQTQAQLSVAVESRDLIGTAKGILMERHGIDIVQAFAVLVEASKNTNMKLRDVAARLVDEHAKPGSPDTTSHTC
jgi:transcriptional regulator with GAF, ATPase, and Fis domain